MKLPIYISVILLILTVFLPAGEVRGQEAEPLGIAMENFDYPYPYHFLPLKVQGKDVRMAYMDISPEGSANGQTVMLMHGKNFFGAYWEDVIGALTSEGYRVVVPDQIGFGKSSKPIIRYSFHLMGEHTRILMDHLGIDRVVVAGHSMGGMVASRFALMYPERVSHLILENPIGLEDYRRLTPWIPAEQMVEGVMSQTEDRIRQYHQNYYVEWKETYETYVQVHYRWTLSGDYPRLAMVSAITSQMVYEQPVIHEFPDISVPTLLIIGQEDRTAIGRNRAEPETAARMGYYPDLGKRAAERIPDARLVELEQIGHIPHFETFERFMNEFFLFISE